MRITAEPKIKMIHAFYKQHEIEAVLNGLIATNQWETLGKYTDREISPLDIKNWNLTLNATQEEVNNAPMYLKSRLLMNIK